jgi:Tol biopolymer transport system component
VAESEKTAGLKGTGVYFSKGLLVGMAALLVLVFAGLITFYVLSPAPVPRVIRSVQLTHSGRVDGWTSMVTDGSRIYFTEREGDHWNLVQTSVSGGDSQVVAAPFRNTVVKDISPDHANFLIASFVGRNERMPLWIWPVQGGAPKRVGEITAYDAAWCPNGRQIVYSKDDGIYLVDADGSNAHKIVSNEGEGRAARFSWSPDGRLLRFSASAQETTVAIWEVHSDGTQLRRLLPGWSEVPQECCGSWTPDGKYFLFYSRHSGSGDIWAIHEKGSFFHHRRAEPIRLTAGPADFGNPLMSKDGRKVFVYGSNGKAEVVRFDLKSRQFLPILSGSPLRGVYYSADQEWVASVSLDWTLARMKPDGTQRLVLTPTGLGAWEPRWSPDSKQIAFIGRRKNRTTSVFLVSPDGGTPRELFPDDQNQADPAWSPDGKLIAFTREEKTSTPGAASGALYTFNLSTNQLSLVPGSLGLRVSAWSPDGRFITAKDEDDHKLMLFDVRTQKWTQLAEGVVIKGPPSWSKDGTCIYYQDILAPNQPVYSIRLSDHKRETVVTFEQFLRGSALTVAFQGLAPDGSIMASVVRNDSDIYSLDLDLPQDRRLEVFENLRGKAGQRNDAKEAAALYQTVAALRELESGNREQARADADAALKLVPNRDVSAMVGDRKGERLAAELDKAFPLDTLVQRYWLPTIRAAVALQRSEPCSRFIKGHEHDRT